MLVITNQQDSHLITAFAKNHHGLFVSNKVSNYPWSSNSYIWRFNFDWERLWPNVRSELEKFDNANVYHQSVLCMVTTENYLFAELTDNILWRCLKDRPESCEEFAKITGDEIIGINGIDYDDKNKKSTLL